MAIRLLATTPIWCLVPAAGLGSRMQSTTPKQYLLLGDKPLLEHSLQRLLAVQGLAGVAVAISPDDHYWTSLACASDVRIHALEGGAERAYSVLNGLRWLQAQGQGDAWVLVHDAARPCVTVDAIVQLLEQVREQAAVGGILGVPVADTLKQVSAACIEQTLDRRHIWQAQTPQLFPVDLLCDVLARALAAGQLITDEASAMEWAGYQPLMVEGRTDNIKVTRPEDLLLARFILQQQGNE